ncbi:MAG: CTP synthase, partial [Victivallales bacterium]|nr:CTP synthase [Victivallales bacterium]
ITGGVVSGLGKGITAASLAYLLKAHGFNVAMQKFDPYLNVDPGTMSPYQHGEVYVTDDGTETDLDLGHYERFAGVKCDRDSNYTSGKIYSRVIAREREGGYLGATVQMIPHITDEIKQAIRSAAKPGIDIVLTEIGGTAGDIESLPFLEAVRQFKNEAGAGNAIVIHLTLVPFIKSVGELKTKPSQQSVSILHNIGIFPDVLVCRTEVPMEDEQRRKLSLFCNVQDGMVIEEQDVSHSIYEVPQVLAEQQMDTKVMSLLNLPSSTAVMDDWNDLLDRVLHPTRECRIAIVGKYAGLRDAYKSIFESFAHAGIALRTNVVCDMLESEELEGDCSPLGGYDGILVPGGFGQRGVEGKIAALKFARENKVPCLGICLGMQCMVIEYARDVLGYADANSTEFNADTTHPVIDLMENQRVVTNKGGTMRLGAYPCQLVEGTLAANLYAVPNISERHRHRFEFNNAYRANLETAGMKVSGTSPDNSLVELLELSGHPFYIGCQFHPEFKSRPFSPHPLFLGLVKASLSAKTQTSQTL